VVYYSGWQERFKVAFAKTVANEGAVPLVQMNPIRTKIVRSITHDPILIAETSATPVASQPAKIADLFAGIHLYGLLGFVWFDSVDKVDWRLSSPAAITAFRRGAEVYRRLAS
jgi:hypothetical protein